MPSTVQSILKAVGVTRSGVAQWGERLEPPNPGEPGTGIYVVALTSRLNRVDGTLVKAPIANAALDTLLRRRPGLSIDGTTPTRQVLARRVQTFWFPDETILYIGLAGPRKNHAGRELPHRVGEYAKTRLGAKSPHAGGWPLLTLSNLEQLSVHYAYCEDVVTAEHDALKQFADHVSTTSRAAMPHYLKVMPFANMEFPKGTRKDAQVAGVRGPVSPSARVPW